MIILIVVHVMVTVVGTPRCLIIVSNHSRGVCMEIGEYIVEVCGYGFCRNLAVMLS